MPNKTELIEKAIIHLLGENIGFEESVMYWSMLKKETLEGLNKSKKYRTMNRLFNLGFLLRVKKKGLSEYIPIPPTFLHFNYNLDRETIEKQEKIYLKNYIQLFNEKDIILESTGEVIDSLILFFIRYMMEKEAFIVLGGPPIFSILKKEVPEKFNNIKFIGIKKYFEKYPFGETNIKLKKEEIISDRRFCIIDNKLVISFFKSLGGLFDGYITSNKENIEFKKKEFDALQRLS